MECTEPFGCHVCVHTSVRGVIPGVQYEDMPKRFLAPANQPEVPRRGDTECFSFSSTCPGSALPHPRRRGCYATTPRTHSGGVTLQPAAPPPFSRLPPQCRYFRAGWDLKGIVRGCYLCVHTSVLGGILEVYVVRGCHLSVDTSVLGGISRV